MPLGPGVRYVTTKSGVRLAYKGNEVIEAKNVKTGAIHTSAEFKADRNRRKQMRSRAMQ